MDLNAQNPADYARRLLATQPRLRAYIRSLVFNPGDVDDIMQDVATVGWERFGTYDRERPFDAWLLGVARNMVYQYFEKQQKRATLLGHRTLQQLDAVAFEASEKAPYLQDALEACLSKLGREDNELIALRYKPDASNRTVAQKLNVSESKISRALNRVYAQLLLCIKQQERSVVAGPGTGART